MADRPLRVLVAGDLPASFPRRDFAGRVALAEAPDEAALCEQIRRANVLFGSNVPDIVPAETPDLAWIQLPSAGADYLRARPVWQSDIVITSSKGIHTVPMSEHLFAMLLALVRQIPAIVRAQERREWIKDHDGFGELRGKTMGILGWGKIGDGIAHLAAAFGMRVIGTRFSVSDMHQVPRDGQAYRDPPWLEPVELAPNMVYPARRLPEVLAQSDVIVAVLPLTDATQGLLDDAAFAHVKPGSLFCNMGRGPVVDEGALVRALQDGKIAGAGLDVYATEPLPASSPLWAMPQVIVSPHVGGFSPYTAERAAHFFAVNLGRYLEGQPLLNLVDREREY